MSSAKSQIWTVLIWGILGTSGHADTLSSAGGWQFWTNSSAASNPSNPAPQQLSGPNPTFTPSASSGPGTVYDARIDLGTNPYPEQGVLTTGGAQPWYESPVVQHVFGGTPNAQQQASFAAEVLGDVQASFQASGVPVTLTIDPNATAAHTVSVVSNTSNAMNPGAIGIADLGNNGFTFIDKFGQAQSVDELAMAVSHNVAHELMHSFGVPEQPNTKGAYVDNETTTWPILTTPNLPFSPTVISLFQSLNFQNGPGTTGITSAPQVLGDDTLPASPVPEPSTIILWGFSLLAFARAIRCGPVRVGRG